MCKKVINYFGYDPINKEFKVLCMTIPPYRGVLSQEHQVLTLGTGGKLSWDWRMVECNIQHYPVDVDTRDGQSVYDGICINGVLYYFAMVREWMDDLLGIVSFQIRSENFKFINKAQGMEINSGVSTLINYKGKLASLHYYVDDNGIYTRFQLWVLEDVNKHQWSQHIYVLPPSWLDTVAAGTKLRFVGMTSTGEIVLSADYIADSFYLVYYNPEKNTVSKVEIHGMGAFKDHKAYTFLDHVEDVKLKPNFWFNGSYS